jgi:hypothetical protein
MPAVPPGFPPCPAISGCLPALAVALVTRILLSVLTAL